MDNKVYVTIYVPVIEKSFDLFIPIGRSIKSVIKLSSKAVSELTNGVFSADSASCLYNQCTGNKYDFEVIVKDTDIRNGTNLILI